MPTRVGAANTVGTDRVLFRCSNVCYRKLGWEVVLEFLEVSSQLREQGSGEVERSTVITH